MVLHKIKGFFFIFFCACLFMSASVKAETIYKKFERAVKSNDCDTVVKLFPKLVAENQLYYNTLSNFYEKGICLPQDYKKAFEAFLQSPDDFSGLKEIKLGQFYANGWGVEKNEVKAKEFFEKGVKKELLRHEKFSDVRIGLDLVLGTKTLPAQLEEIITFYEKTNWTADQKFDFAMNYIKVAETLQAEERGYIYLQNIAGRYNHAKAAFEVSKWYRKNDDIASAYSYLFSAAINGSAIAQAEIGRQYFAGDTSDLSKTLAFEMLLRAHTSGIISDNELNLAAKQLHDFELELAREEAAKPLPQQ